MPIHAHPSVRGICGHLLLVRATKCHFAVKSGGHAAFAGASNIQDGLAIDLSGLSALTLSSNNSILSVGPGNRWEDVYAFLNPFNLSVIGGRVGDIGVGGLTLGGGISFFSPFYGWACDNVANYEVVLSNGSVVDANSTSHPDLYFALRGGGNNFGIVTRFDLETFPHGDMWGGQVYHPIQTNGSQFEAYHWFAENSNSDPNGALILTAVGAPGYGFLFANNYEYARPVENPPMFDNFTSLTNFSSTMRITRLPDLAEELKDAQGYGFRQMYITATFKNDVQMMKDIFNMWHAAVDSVLMDIADFVAGLVFQPVTPRVVEKFGKNNGNALGISPDDGSLTIWMMPFQWSNENNDTFIINTLESIVSRANTIAKSRGLYHRYIYQNYAYISQDVFAGYGPENKARLLEIQQAYDPEKIFVDSQPGYFKLIE